MNRKLLLTTIALSLLIASVAGATETRVLTLGNVNHIVKDVNNIGLYPQMISNYPMWGSMEINGSGPGALYSIGGHYKYGGAVYGLYLDNTGLPEGGMYGPVVGESGAGDNTTAPKLNLYYGRKLGDVPFGLNLNIYQNSWKDKTTGSSAEKSQMYFGLGLGATLMEKLDLGLTFRSHSFTDKSAAGTDVSKPNGGMLLDINARYWHMVDEHTSVIPYVMIQMNNVGVDSTNIGKSSDNSTAFALGCGLNEWVNDNTMLVGDFGISISSEEMKYEPTGGTSVSQKISRNQLPYYRFCFETVVNSWLVARAGAERSWIDYSNDKVQEIGTATTGLYLGAGLKKGDFMLDLAVDPGILNRGPYLLTGSGGNLSTMASLRYMPSK